jgi:hypothetical protein
MTVARRRKKETYRDRWLKEHPRISLYLKRDEYERLKSIAESRGMSVKELILSLIEGFNKYYDDIGEKEFDEGYRLAFELFYEEPYEFYDSFKDIYPDTEPALFTVPCFICGKPIIFTHRDENWAKEVRPALLEAFRRWRHVCCGEVVEGKRGSCPHLLKLS